MCSLDGVHERQARVQERFGRLVKSSKVATTELLMHNAGRRQKVLIIKPIHRALLKSRHRFHANIPRRCYGILLPLHDAALRRLPFTQVSV